MNQPKDIYAVLTALLEQAEHELANAEQLACDVEGIDSQCADACRFDAGTLYACQCILRAIESREEVLGEIDAMVKEIAELNSKRRAG